MATTDEPPKKAKYLYSDGHWDHYNWRGVADAKKFAQRTRAEQFIDPDGHVYEEVDGAWVTTG